MWKRSIMLGKPEKLTAENDITVYKIMTENNNGLASYPIGFKYKRGNKYELGDELQCCAYEDFDKYYRIKEGFHSYYGRCRVGVSKYNDDIYVHSSADAVRSNVRSYQSWLWSGASIVAVECIIPKGSVYYRNEYDEIVSDKLVVTEWSVPVAEIKKQYNNDCITFQELFNEMKEGGKNKPSFIDKKGMQVFGFKAIA